MATTVTAPTTMSRDEQRDAFVGRLLQGFLGTMDAFAIYLGHRLDYYRNLAASGPATPAQLAQRTGTHERYSREWLEQQAASGILEVDDPGKDAEEREYRISPAHAEVLTDTESLNYLAPLAQAFAAIGRVTDRIVEAYRTGGGVSWSEFGPEMREAQAASNRTFYLQQLATEVLPAMPDVDARLRADPPARVADIACGGGWSSIAIAKGYPKARVDGFDLDAPSIELAEANLAGSGVEDRVRFEARDAAAADFAGRYDLVLIAEALHDMSRPVEALRTARKILAPGGSVVVIDERTGENFTAPADDLDRLFYGYSILCCLLDGMSHQPSAATGTVMRPATLRRYAQEAGFGDVEILPIEPSFFRVYRLIT
jgi:2-polyprenyl-3-methyl-5-hydroxy-6-metoxy-1,4-benzoquinol methylase